MQVVARASRAGSLEQTTTGALVSVWRCALGTRALSRSLSPSLHRRGASLCVCVVLVLVRFSPSRGPQEPANRPPRYHFSCSQQQIANC